MPDRNKSELLLRQRKVLADFGDVALQSEDLDAVLHEACRLAGEALGTGRAKVLEIEEGGESLLVRAGVGWAPDVVGQVHLPMDEHSSETHAIKLGEPVITQDIAREERFDLPDFLKKAGVVALVNVPILRPGKRAYGLLQVDDTVPRDFDQDDIEFLRTYATILGLVIDRLLKLQGLRTSEERFGAFVTATNDVVYRMSPDWSEMYELRGRGFLADMLRPSTAWEESYIHPDDQATVQVAIDQAIRTQSVFELEHRVRLAEGGLVWVLSRAVPIKDTEGQTVEWLGAARDVSARRAAEERLREVEERHRSDLERQVQERTAELKVSHDLLQATMDTSLDMIQVFEAVRNEAGEIVDFRWVLNNRTSERTYGKIEGESLLERNPGVVAEGIFDALKRVTESGTPEQAEHHYVHEQFDGWFLQSVTKLGDGVATSTKDITDWKQAEDLRLQEALAQARLRESEDRFRAIVETATDYAIFTTDPEGLITTWPAGAQAVFGWNAAEAIGQSMDMTFVPEDRAIGAPETERMTARTAGQCPNVRWHLRADGSRVFIDGVTRPLRGEDGTVTGFVKVGQDVTERHREEARRKALVRLAERLRDLGDPVEIAFAASEELGRELGASRVGYGTMDHDAETLHVERDWTAPGVATLAGATWLRQFGSFVDAMKRGEVTIVTDGRTDPRVAGTEAVATLDQLSGRAFVNVPVIERGRLVALLFVNDARARDWSSEDLTLIQEVAGWTRTAVERARNAAALRELNETLEARVEERTAERDRMWDTSPDLMLIIDFKGVFQRVNPAWTTILGYAPEELVGHHVNEFVVPEDHAETVGAYELAAHGGLPRIVNRYRHKDGSLRWISWTAAPAGDMTYATGRDITAARERQAELEAAQEQLRQSQKMEAMGQLTGGVAHDFNNLLTPIIGSLDRLLTRGVGSPRERQLMDGALQSAERAKTLVQRLLAFARRQPLQPTAVDVGQLVTSMADLLSSTTGPRIDLRVELPPDLPPAQADANQLEMALLNLAVNARDAMPEGGTLTISAERVSVRTGRRTKLRPGHYVRLSVQDTGLGMDPATLARAVEPFFSTKGIGKGTGLGLSMVHGLASQLGGGLTITSHPGQGTTVELWLPISAVAVEENGQAHGGAVAPKAHGTALLVDDEDLVRMSTADMLIDLGYEVVEATSAEGALQQVQEGLRPDLVVTDHLMPGMSGVNLARELRSRQSDLPVLIVSGYAETDGIAPGFPRLTKPFRAAELAASLSALVPNGKK